MGPLREEQQFAGPHPLKLWSFKHKGTSFNGILNQHLLSFEFRDDKIPPVRSLGDCRQGCPGQVTPTCLDQARFQI